ncbi:MAG: hypothetical protein H8D97_00205 [Proteobacteria bacterium]|nr:hypothetical protein [Pseudomonadota bacterium]
MKKLSKKTKPKKLIKQLFNSVIDSINIGNNGECHIKFKSDLVLETEGSQIFYTKNGRTAIQAKTLHLNPKTNGIEEKINNLKIDHLCNDMHEESLKKLLEIKKENSTKDNKCGCENGGCC